jgi:hypothetical protein
LAIRGFGNHRDGARETGLRGRNALAGGPPRLLDNIGRERGLSDRNIHSLAVDSAGNLCVGTSAAGVMRIDRLGFTTYREQDGLPIERVWSAGSGCSPHVQLPANTPGAFAHSRAPY